MSTKRKPSKPSPLKATTPRDTFKATITIENLTLTAEGTIPEVMETIRTGFAALGNTGAELIGTINRKGDERRVR